MAEDKKVLVDEVIHWPHVRWAGKGLEHLESVGKCRENLISTKLICGYKSDGLFWFRILGYGLHFKDTSKRRMLFSEREGYGRRVRVGSWLIKILKP